MSFLEHIARAVSGDSSLAQDIKTYGDHIDILISYIISIFGVVAVFILTKFLLFQGLQQNLNNILQTFDAETQNIILATIPKSFSAYLLNDIWQIIAVIIGITIIWLAGTGLIHLLSIFLKGQAKLIDALVFTSLLLPLSILFSSIFLILALTVVLKTGLLIIIAMILFIILIIILIRALIKGLSALYAYPIANSVIALVSTIIIFSITLLIIWNMVIPI